jgi:vacuolar-type H+-ATPase subunit D/Vma8
VAAYEDRLLEKNDKLKLLKKKIDDLATKFKTILDENNQLHTRLERLPLSQKSDAAYEEDYDT